MTVPSVGTAHMSGSRAGRGSLSPDLPGGGWQGKFDVGRGAGVPPSRLSPVPFAVLQFFFWLCGLPGRALPGVRFAGHRWKKARRFLKLMEGDMANRSGIHIKRPGALTAKAKRAGMSLSAFEQKHKR